MVHQPHPGDVEAADELGEPVEQVDVLRGDHVVDHRHDTGFVQQPQSVGGAGERALPAGAFVHLRGAPVDADGDQVEELGDLPGGLRAADDRSVGDHVDGQPAVPRMAGDLEQVLAQHRFAAGEDEVPDLHVGDLVDQVERLGGVELPGQGLLGGGVAVGAAQVAAVRDGVVHGGQRRLGLADRGPSAGEVDQPVEHQLGQGPFRRVGVLGGRRGPGPATGQRLEDPGLRLGEDAPGRQLGVGDQPVPVVREVHQVVGDEEVVPQVQQLHP